MTRCQQKRGQVVASEWRRLAKGGDVEGGGNQKKMKIWTTSRTHKSKSKNSNKEKSPTREEKWRMAHAKKLKQKKQRWLACPTQSLLRIRNDPLVSKDLWVTVVGD